MPPKANNNQRSNHNFQFEQDSSLSVVQESTTNTMIITTKPSKKKSVSFNPYVQVKKTLHINDYIDEEIEATWYNELELYKIREEIKITIYMINSGLLDVDNNTTTSCRRGLEHCTLIGSQRHVQNKRNAYYAVLNEQNEQWEDNVYEPKYIAKVYSIASYHCSVTAIAIALQDEIDAATATAQR